VKHIQVLVQGLRCTCIRLCFTRDRVLNLHIVHLHTYYAGVTRDILSPITVKSSISIRQRWWASGGVTIETLSIDAAAHVTQCFDTLTIARSSQPACRPVISNRRYRSRVVAHNSAVFIDADISLSARRRPDTDKRLINVLPPAEIRMLDARGPPATYGLHHLSLDGAYSQACMMSKCFDRRFAGHTTFHDACTPQTRRTFIDHHHHHYHHHHCRYHHFIYL